MKKALLTTTALVALNGAAFASSIDTPVNSAEFNPSHSQRGNNRLEW